MRTPHPPVVGTVEVWHAEDGWGVLRTPDAVAVWCHFSQIEMDGYRSLEAGQRVCFDFEVPGQDGYEARVLTSVKPAPQVPYNVAAVSDGAYDDALDAWSESWRLLLAGVAAWRCQVRGESPPDGELVAPRERERLTREVLAAMQPERPLRQP